MCGHECNPEPGDHESVNPDESQHEDRCDASVELGNGHARTVMQEHGIGRAMMLNVAGAYHSRLMESAYVKLEKVLADVPMQAPRFPVISNVTGEEVKTPEQIRETLRDQVTGTVRWADCMQRLIDLGCDFFIELGPGNVLAALLKRTHRNVAVISVGEPESVQKCTADLAQ